MSELARRFIFICSPWASQQLSQAQLNRSEKKERDNIKINITLWTINSTPLIQKVSKSIESDGDIHRSCSSRSSFSFDCNCGVVWGHVLEGVCTDPYILMGRASKRTPSMWFWHYPFYLQTGSVVKGQDHGMRHCIACDCPAWEAWLSSVRRLYLWIILQWWYMWGFLSMILSTCL